MREKVIYLRSQLRKLYCVVGTRMKIEYGAWWNDINRKGWKYSERNLFKCHLFHHKSHMEWPGISLRPPAGSPAVFSKIISVF